jgi:radical SAM superfamily enzyme YgiQ (UPF0313 family)
MGQYPKQTKSAASNRELLSLEQGAIRKKWKNRLPVALIYPNQYSLGMSNLGFQLIYRMLNQNDAIVAERVFFPVPGHKPVSLESGRPLADFPLLLFSVSFEQDYPKLIMLLKMANIPPLASERTRKSRRVRASSTGGQPLVAAGGVATFMNPEPLAPFVDLFVIGEAEPILNRLTDFFIRGLEYSVKEELLKEIVTSLSGCYAPELYQVTYDTEGNFVSNKPKADSLNLPQRIKKVLLDSPGSIASHSTVLTPRAEFSDLFMAELGRGCSRGCRFCAAGFIYRPPRLWQAESIINAIDSRPDGNTRVGLLGMEMVRPEDMTLITDFLAGQSCSLSFSSLRADIINSSLLELLGNSSLKSAAIAPDGGSERLRLVINKGITENDVLKAAELLVKHDIRNLKLYFMIGLPTEEQPDLDEMTALILKVRDKILAVGRSKGKLSTLTLSINCFIPKPWTPFQFHPMETVKILKQKLKFLRKKFASVPNIRIKTESPEKAYFQAVLARGDRRVGQALLTMIDNNCTWKQACKINNIDPAYYVLRRREKDEPFPWEIVDHGIERKYLWSEYQKALQGKKTNPCDTSRCKRCGVC